MSDRNRVKIENLNDREYLLNTAENGTWKFDDLCKIFKRSGLQGPYTLIRCGEDEKQKPIFEIRTPMLKEMVNIVLTEDKFQIRREDKIVEYKIEYDDYDDSYRLLTVFRHVKKEKNFVSTNVTEKFLSFYVGISNECSVEIEIYYPIDREHRTISSFYARRDDIEKFLMNLATKGVQTEQVYEKMLKFLKIDNNTLSKSKKISVIYKDIQCNHVKSGVVLKEGKIQEYAMLLENGETFHIYSNGDWEYFYKKDGVRRIIYYNKEENDYVFTEKIKKDNVEKVLKDEFISHVGKEITRLQDSVRNWNRN